MTGKLLSIFLMAGRETPALAEAAVEGGADLLEIGFPYSDPLADGPVIRRAAERALAEGMRTTECMECLTDVGRRIDVPLYPMTYAGVLEAYGYERFAEDAQAAGAEALIVADLPIDMRPALRRVHLVAPNTTHERIALAAVQTAGWLYLVTVTGTTGPRTEVPLGLAEFVARARVVTPVPLLAGFGIATPEHAAQVAALTDGVIVGSRAVEVAEEGPWALLAYVRTLRGALDGAPDGARPTGLTGDGGEGLEGQPLPV